MPPPARSRASLPLLVPKPPPAEFTETYTLRHRHRPWVAHQKLVIFSFLGDSAVVLMSLMLAYVIRFETGMREVGVIDSVISFRSYCGHVLVGSAFLIFLLANFRLHDPRNFLAIRKTFGIIAKTCVIWGVAFLALALVLKIDPPISRMYCAIGCASAMAGMLAWRWVLYCVLRQNSFADRLRQKAVFVGWNEECERAVKRFSDGRSHQISVCGVISPPGDQWKSPLLRASQSSDLMKDSDRSSAHPEPIWSWSWMETSTATRCWNSPKPAAASSSTSNSCRVVSRFSFPAFSWKVSTACRYSGSARCRCTTLSTTPSSAPSTLSARSSA